MKLKSPTSTLKQSATPRNKPLVHQRLKLTKATSDAVRFVVPKDKTEVDSSVENDEEQLIVATYLLYGFLRPFLSREMKRDIEEDEDEEEAKLAVLGQSPNSLPSVTDSKSLAPTTEKPQH